MQLTNANSGEMSFGSLIDAVSQIEDQTSMSLTQFTRRSTINSRVFIEKQLAGEEILAPVMLNIMNLYTGLILTAVNMNRYITGSRKVRDAMSIVATEGFDAMPQYSGDLLNKFLLGNQDTFHMPKSTKMEIVRSDGTSFEDGEYGEATTYGAGSGSKVLDTEPKNANLPSGRVIEVNFGANGTKAGDAPSGNFTINLFLQLLPTFIPTDVAEQFIALNFSPSIKQRWMQVSAGEISFINDLILGQDMRKRRRKALKNDKSGALKDMIERQENALSNSWLKLLMIRPERQNIANTILIFEKRTFDKACSRSGLKFSDYNQRQKFFNKTFAMMCCTIDPMYNKIETFYHGLNAVSQFTFDQCKRNARTDNVDLQAVMKAYSQGMAPKY